MTHKFPTLNANSPFTVRFRFCRRVSMSDVGRYTLAGSANFEKSGTQVSAKLTRMFCLALKRRLALGGQNGGKRCAGYYQYGEYAPHNALPANIGQLEAITSLGDALRPVSPALETASATQIRLPART